MWTEDLSDMLTLREEIAETTEDLMKFADEKHTLPSVNDVDSVKDKESWAVTKPYLTSCFEKLEKNKGLYKSLVNTMKTLSNQNHPTCKEFIEKFEKSGGIRDKGPSEKLRAIISDTSEKMDNYYQGLFMAFEIVASARRSFYAVHNTMKAAYNFAKDPFDGLNNRDGLESLAKDLDLKALVLTDSLEIFEKEVKKFDKKRADLLQQINQNM